MEPTPTPFGAYTVKQALLGYGPGESSDLPLVPPQPARIPIADRLQRGHAMVGRMLFPDLGEQLLGHLLAMGMQFEEPQPRQYSLMEMPGQNHVPAAKPESILLRMSSRMPMYGD